MSDEYVDVNKFAAEGGDTAPGTKEQIAERNAQAQEVVDAQVENAKALQKARQEHLDSEVDLTDDLLEDGDPGVLGAPIPPSHEPIGLSGGFEGRLKRKDAEGLRGDAEKSGKSDKQAEKQAAEDKKSAEQQSAKKA